jgi:hypothetical protein
MTSPQPGDVTRQFVIQPGEEAEFQAFLDDLESDIQPETPLEYELFLKLADAAWTLRRCRRAETVLGAAGCDPLLDAACAAALQRIESGERRAEEALARAMVQLRKLQLERAYAMQDGRGQDRGRQPATNANPISYLTLLTHPNGSRPQ